MTLEFSCGRLQHAGGDQAILIVTLATCVVFLAVVRHWRPVVFIALPVLVALSRM
ncbi:MAG TPA: hypothetical protein VK280_25210 [Streptosporangiaceae bacterium]|nr:hypothetical protein [Streptosporangiaceae bacterium]